MKINVVKHCSFSSKEQCLKEFSTKLVDAKRAIVRTRLNEGGNPRFMEYIGFDKYDNIEECRGIYREPKSKLEEIINFLGKIQKVSSSNILEKFYNALSH